MLSMGVVLLLPVITKKNSTAITVPNPPKMEAPRHHQATLIKYQTSGIKNQNISGKQPFEWYLTDIITGKRKIDTLLSRKISDK